MSSFDKKIIIAMVACFFIATAGIMFVVTTIASNANSVAASAGGLAHTFMQNAKGEGESK